MKTSVVYLPDLATKIKLILNTNKMNTLGQMPDFIIFTNLSIIYIYIYIYIYHLHERHILYNLHLAWKWTQKKRSEKYYDFRNMFRKIP